jgi:uroporphyrin-III C-methyltransferase / precorrin-2 dehydrogenase / sirohydrochlorin ferrochelatase
MKVYPVFLRLEDQPVVIVGGGPVAASKLDGLLAAGAVVTIVAPVVSPGCRRPEVHIIERGFRSDDLDGARFVIAAATAEVNRAVAAAAAERHLFVNAVDDLDSATAFLGGVVRRDDITIAISTGGAAPALAGLLREALDATLPSDLEPWLAIARTERGRWRTDHTPIEERRDQLLRALIARRNAGALS